MLLRYEEAVRRMMARSEGTPTGWIFQWYIHAVRSGADGRSQKLVELQRIYGSTPSDNRALASRVWDTCSAHHPGTNERFFLPWHRMYVEFFERVCRSVLGDDSFMLPYWNYSNTNFRALPDRFTERSSPLFRPDRNDFANRRGSPIATEGDLRADIWLGLPAYDDNGSRPGFNSGLDNNLHGTVHVRVGNRERGMGVVPWAANDPIFWLHHCNIDRLWASWNAAGRGNPTDRTWLDQRFEFVGADGRSTAGTVSDFADLSRRGYRYARLEPVPSAASTEDVEMAEAEPKMLARSRRDPAQRGIALGAEPVRVRLRVQEGVEEAIPSRVDALAGGRRLYLVVNDLQTEHQPGIIYRVFLELPEGASREVAERHLAGTINFFNAGASHGSSAGRRFSFDVTELARRLRAEGKLGDEPHVTIVPIGKPASDAKPLIGGFSLVEQ
jgi:tyrosinase